MDQRRMTKEGSQKIDEKRKAQTEIAGKCRE
jgi:hypothetical protein